MTVLTFRFYRLDTTVSPTGEATTERVEVRPPIDYDSGNPAPGTEIKIIGFPPCQCPQAPACHAKEMESRGPASPRPQPPPQFPRRRPYLPGCRPPPGLPGGRGGQAPLHIEHHPPAVTGQLS